MSINILSIYLSIHLSIYLSIHLTIWGGGRKLGVLRLGFGVAARVEGSVCHGLRGLLACIWMCLEWKVYM